MENTAEDSRVARHVVVGGGCAGILLTRKLLDMGYYVTLVDESDRNIHLESNPMSWTEFNASKVHGKLESEPQDALFGRKIVYPFGKTIGGSTNINAMIWSSGHGSVFDRFWPKCLSSATISRFSFHLIPLCLHVTTPSSPLFPLLLPLFLSLLAPFLVSDYSRTPRILSSPRS